VWLARRGLDTTAVDVSAVGLALCDERARREGLGVRTMRRDLETLGLPVGPWDLILVTDYLQRDLMGSVVRALAPGGVLLWRHPTVRNLERHPTPSRRFLLEEGEGAALLEGLELLSLEEGWGALDRHELRVVARRPSAA
jgi:SAM-dependent methyltransferase